MPTPAESFFPRSETEALRISRRLAQLLDAAFTIPGTQIRVGLDALLGLIPGIGDLTGAALSGVIVVTAARQGASKAVLARMLLNLGVDTVIGSIPVLGDLFDLGFRANLRNADLLEAHLAQPRRTRNTSRGLVAGVILALFALAAIGIALLYWIGKSLYTLLS